MLSPDLHGVLATRQLAKWSTLSGGEPDSSWDLKRADDADWVSVREDDAADSPGFQGLSDLGVDDPSARLLLKVLSAKTRINPATSLAGTDFRILGEKVRGVSDKSSHVTSGKLVRLMKLARTVQGSAEQSTQPIVRSFQLDASAIVAWSRIDKTVEMIGSYSSGWDGEDAAPIPQEHVDRLRALVRKLKVASAPPPTEAFAIGDGEIGLRWRSVDAFASASLLTDGRFLAHVRSVRLPNRFSLDAGWESALDLSTFVSALRHV